jgi:L-glyceraldehyde 3-phosphate reductase
MLKKLNALNDFAKERGASLSALAILWVLRDKRNTSVLLGASSSAQLRENLAALAHAPLAEDEIGKVEKILQMPQ